MRRLMALITIATVVVLGTVGQVAAVTSTLSPGVVFPGTSISGGPFAPSGSCLSGTGIILGPPIEFTEVRCAFEFDISGIPAGATITSAVLSTWGIPDISGCQAFGCAADIFGYTGNGVGEVSDLTTGSALFTNYQTSAFSYDDHDVTAFVTGLFGTGDDWAGFRMSKSNSGLSGSVQWNSPDRGPLLTITYDLPSTPTPSPTPTPAASLLNAATADARPIQPTGVLGFGLLLVATLSGLALAAARHRAP